MNYLKHLRQSLGYKICICLYILFFALVVCNQILWNIKIVESLLRIVLYGILLFKGIGIIYRYSKAINKQPGAKQVFVDDKKKFTQKYRWFRLQVSLWWIAFTIICGIVKYIWNTDYNYYFGLSFLLLAVDLIFVNYTCLLQIFSDPKAKVVKCCCGCPVRGWDLLMINTPLLFAGNTDVPSENIFTIIAIILAVISFMYWEKNKYTLVEIREKCARSCDLKMCVEYRDR